MFEISKQLPGHSGEVRCGTLIGNGLVVTGGFDASCCVWDMTKGCLVRQIFGFSDFVYSVCPHPFNPDWFIAGSKDRHVIVFDSMTGEKMIQFKSSPVIHTGPVCSVAAQGILVAVGSWDGSISLWSLETGQLVLHIKNAGAYAVTVTFDTTTGNLISGSQDKALRVFATDGSLLQELPNAHADIIRSISAETDLVVTTSNDARIVLTNHDLSPLGVMTGHENFVFSVSRLGSLIASASEDRTVRVWDVNSQSCVQTVRHPGTVWFAIFVGVESKLATGCADGIVRLFSTDPTQYADPEEVANYHAMCAPPEQEGEQIDPATVPSEEDMYRWPGKKVGEVKMFKDAKNTVYAYQWTALRSWEKVGLVTGGGGSRKQKLKKQYGGDEYFPAGEYDFLFDVELGEARMALLPYNDGDNPLVVAEKFCAREVINKANLSQIIDFIKTNTGASVAAPASSSSASMNAPTPVASKHFPTLTPFLFKEAKWPQLLAKIKEVNASIPDPLNAEDLNAIDNIVTLLQQPPSHSSRDFRPSDISLVHSKLVSKFPSDSLFVVFDLWRLFVLNGAAAVMYKDSDSGSQYMISAAKHLQANYRNNTGLCAARYLANLFASSISKWAAVDRHTLYLPVTVQGLSTPGVSKATQIALASVLANLANSTTEKKSAKSIELAKSLVDQLASLIKSLVASADPDVMYRLLVALGCALVGSNGQAYSSAIPSITQDVLSHYTQDFITECCLDIKRNV